MKLVVFFLLGIFLVSLVSVDALTNSTTDTNFNIWGCNFEFNNNIVAVAAGTCSTGNASGYFYCDENKNGWNTLDSGYGCSMGEINYTLGENFCCPSGMFCNKTTGGYECNTRVNSCSNQKTESDCNSNGCIWLNETGTCVEGIKDLSCEYYKTAGTCGADELNLGVTGVGTELCGKHITCDGRYFSVPSNKCGCEWHQSAPVGKHCQLELTGAQIFYDPSVGQDVFKCSNTYELGKCKNGTQSVEWSSTNSIVSGFNGSSEVPQDCLEALKCTNGSSTRMCGEPMIKMPMFSLFSLIASSVIIGLFYFLKQINLNKEKS